MRKIIFGKQVFFIVEHKFELLVSGATDLYADGNRETDDLVINIVSQLKDRPIQTSNPKIYKKVENGFIANFGETRICYIKSPGRPVYIEVEYRRRRNGVRATIKMARSMEFGTEIDRFVQVLHELVLLPATYFFDDLAPLHAASFSINQRGVVFTGTGGVGKSSALLVASERNDISFLSDDMALVRQGRVYGNMAWPKIYGYNCSGSEIRKLIFKDRGTFDRLHFYLKNRIDPSSVRRKIRPDDLFCSVCADGVELNKVILVFRMARKGMSVESISKENFVEASIAIMSAEYQVFHKFVEWEEYNCTLLGQKPVLSMTEIKINWRMVLNSINDCDFWVLNVPMEIEHEEYRTEIRKILRG
ncbi:MAG: hypothetical protein H3C27_15050 [Opitutaceae bacterium]|nr:hypothetical protein [Opitutaceae bacterium]